MTEPSDELIAEFGVFCWHLCNDFGASEQSGYRTEKHNNSVGGMALSKHAYLGGWGLARDLHFDTPEGRDEAVGRILDRRADGYRCKPYLANPLRLHLQRFPVGVLPQDFLND